MDESRTKLVSEVEKTLTQVAEWGQKNLVNFNPSKTQVCVFTTKKGAPFVVAPQFQGTPLTISNKIGILGVEISDSVQYCSHLE
ncbi:hypothetical protein, partial [Proteus terrae]|uniref:hypothetical protein n=1 Tax=Proteus terrae TaxID=1574161 RepID=UPI00301BE837